MTLRPVSRAIVFCDLTGRPVVSAGYALIDDTSIMECGCPLRSSLPSILEPRSRFVRLSSVAQLIDHWICWWNACSSINRGSMYDGRQGEGEARRREFELNCKTLLRWKWAAKIIERLMDFLEWRSEWQKFKRPLEFQKLGLSVCLCVCIFRCEGGRQRGGGVKPFPDGV